MASQYTGCRGCHIHSLTNARTCSYPQHIGGSICEVKPNGSSSQLPKKTNSTKQTVVATSARIGKCAKAQALPSPVARLVSLARRWWTDKLYTTGVEYSSRNSSSSHAYHPLVVHGSALARGILWLYRPCSSLVLRNGKWKYQTSFHGPSSTPRTSE